MTAPRLLLQLAASLDFAGRAYQVGYRASDRGQWPNACRYRTPWLRSAWMRGWTASERDRKAATS
jgi:ribosome modulation factor